MSRLLALIQRLWLVKQPTPLRCTHCLNEKPCLDRLDVLFIKRGRPPVCWRCGRGELIPTRPDHERPES